MIEKQCEIAENLEKSCGFGLHLITSVNAKITQIYYPSNLPSNLFYLFTNLSSVSSSNEKISTVLCFEGIPMILSSLP